MSDEVTKLKRSTRFLKDENSIKRQLELARCHGLFNIKDQGKYRKRSWADCGNPQCVMCMNPRKAFGEETIQERRMKQDIEE